MKALNIGIRMDYCNKEQEKRSNDIKEAQTDYDYGNAKEGISRWTH